MMNIDLAWADEQYFSTLMDVAEEYAKLNKKPEKKKVGASDIGKFIV